MIKRYLPLQADGHRNVSPLKSGWFLGETIGGGGADQKQNSGLCYFFFEETMMLILENPSRTWRLKQMQ